MNRLALEHLLRAAAAVTGETTFYVVGSAALLPSWPVDAEIPEVIVRSREADLIPLSGLARTIDLIDGALGQDSTFDGTFGYYADDVELSTVNYAPAGWRDRTVRFANAATQDAVGLCMEPHDLAIAKLCAGRDKDLEFVQVLVGASRLDINLLRERLDLVTAPQGVLGLARERLTAYTKLAPR